MNDNLELELKIVTEDSKHYILKGDWRQEYVILYPDGIDACMNFFRYQNEFKSKWSDMNQSENINELATALSKCQGELRPAIKDSNNTFQKYKYADLNSVWSVCREPLSKNGLAVVQTVGKDDFGDLILTTTLVHSSGQWMRSISPIPIKEEVGKIDPNKKSFKNDPQALGSSISYMRRYNLCCIVGVSNDDDDDGENAMNRTLKDKYPNPQHPQQKEPVKPPYKKQDELTPVVKQDWLEFQDLLKKCSEEHQKNVWNYLESQKIVSENDIDYALLEKLRKGAHKNLDKINPGSV